MNPPRKKTLVFLCVFVALALLVAHRTRRKQRATRLPVPPRAAFVPGQSPPDYSVARLADDDPDVREKAIAEIDDVVDITRLFGSNDGKTRLRAVRALEQLREEAGPAVPALARLLRTDPDPKVRMAVLRALSAIGRFAGKAVPALVQILSGENDEFAAAATDALVNIGPAAAPAVPALIEALDRPGVAREALSALQYIGPEARAAIPKLIALVEKRNDLEYPAIRALGGIGPDAKPAVPLLVERLVQFEEAKRKTKEAMRGRGSVSFIHTDFTIIEALRGIGEPSIPVCIDLLEHEERGVRWDALAVLRRIGKPAIPALHDALNHEKTEVRRGAIAALGHIVSPEKSGVYAAVDAHEALFPKLVAALDDDDVAVRRAATDALAAFGEKAVVHLARMLDDEEWTVRKEAAQSLGTIATWARDAAPALVAALKDRMDSVRWEAAKALVRVEPKNPVLIPALVAALHDDHRFARREVAKTLAHMGKAVVPVLLDALHDDDPTVRALAADVLGKVGAESNVLVDQLAAKDASVRLAAAAALASKKQHADRVVPLLVKLLKEVPASLDGYDQNEIKAKAIRALSEYGAAAHEALPALIEAARNEERLFDKRGHFELNTGDVLKAIDKAVLGIGRHDPDSLAAYLGDPDDWGCGTAARALNQMGEDALPSVVRRLRADDSRVRAHAARIVGQIGRGEESVRAPLARLLDDPSHSVRLAAAEALWATHFDARTVVPVLLELLRTGSPSQRSRAAWTLKGIGARAYFAEDDLRKALDEVPADVKPYVAGVLKVIEEE